MLTTPRKETGFFFNEGDLTDIHHARYVPFEAKSYERKMTKTARKEDKKLSSF